MPGHPGPAFGRPECKLVRGIYALTKAAKDVDGRDRPGHDDPQKFTQCTEVKNRDSLKPDGQS
jgi:hypothetical protein